MSSDVGMAIFLLQSNPSVWEELSLVRIKVEKQLVLSVQNKFSL